MNRCPYCGKEHLDEATQCNSCGTEFSKSPTATSPKANPTLPNKSFFRRKPGSIALALVATIYIIGAVLNVWLAFVSKEQQGGHQLSRFLIQSAIWDTIIAGLCMYARHMIMQERSTSLLAGAATVLIILAIVMHHWLGGLLTDRNPFPILEASAIWLPLIYTAIYAFKEGRRIQVASTPPA